MALQRSGCALSTFFKKKQKERTEKNEEKEQKANITGVITSSDYSSNYDPDFCGKGHLP